MGDMTTFDNLWEQEERQAVQGRLRREYPQWRRRQRTRHEAVVSLAIVAVAAGIALSALHSPLSTYDSVACNRSGIADGHWADVAGRILTIETL